MKMTRLSDTDVEKRLKAYFDKNATMTEKLESVINSLNKPQMIGPNSNEPLKEWPEVGPGEVTVTPHPYSGSAGSELAIVRDANGSELVVDPFKAIYAVQNIQTLPASMEDVWSALMQAAQEMADELDSQQSYEDFGSAISASNYHA